MVQRMRYEARPRYIAGAPTIIDLLDTDEGDRRICWFTFEQKADADDIALAMNLLDRYGVGKIIAGVAMLDAMKRQA